MKMIPTRLFGYKKEDSNMVEEIAKTELKEYPVIIGILKVFGWFAIIIGVISFLVLIAEGNPLCIPSLFSGLVVSTLFFAIARIIRILVDIEENTRKK
jgi:hypothetical protein